MSATLRAAADENDGETPLPEPRPDARRLGTWVRRHGRSLVWLTPVLAVSGVVQSVGLDGSPADSDEATFTAQAWAVVTLGRLAHHDYWYDQFPVGWLQIAASIGLTGGYDRQGVAVVAAREAMVVFLLAGVALVWAIARRIGMARAAATAAALIFALSPLAVQVHRSVSLENVATPWLLASVLLAMSRRNQIAAYVGSAAALGVAGLSKESYLLALPLIAWLVWRGVNPEVRRRALTAFAVTLVIFAWLYLLLFILRDGVVPSAEVLRTANEIFLLDPVLCAAAPVAMVAGFLDRRMRPFAAMLALLLAVVFRPGGLVSVPYLAMLAPFAALGIAGALDAWVRAWQSRPGSVRIPVLAAMALAGTVLLGGAGMLISDRAERAPEVFTAEGNPASAETRSWIIENVEGGSRLIVDDAMWLALVGDGYEPDDLLAGRELQTGIAVTTESPNELLLPDFIVATPQLLGSSRANGTEAALEGSTVVAAFGTGGQQVQVRRILPVGIDRSSFTSRWTLTERTTAGRQLLSNPAFGGSADAVALISTGQVDERIVVMLGQLLTKGEVVVAQVPTVTGEEGLIHRQVLLTSAWGHDLTDEDTATVDGALIDSSLVGPYAAQSVAPTGDGLLVTFPVVVPEGLVH